MIGDANGQPQTFKLDMSDAIALKVQGVIQEAKTRGIETQVIQTLKAIFRRLRTNPLDIGELFKQYPNLNLLVHIVVDYPVVVYAAIHPEKKLVLLQNVFLTFSDQGE